MQGYQLQPGEYFPIVSKVQDPADSATYYPQAVIRNAITLAVIDTVSLASQGSGFYSYSWQVPQDPSGQGLWIEITKTFFNDSGHTDSATPYGAESATHLILDRTFMGSFGGGGGPDIDYKKIKKLMDQAVAGAKFPQMPDIPKPEKVDLSDVIGRLKALPDALAALIPKPKEVDLSAVANQLKAILEAIQGLPAPEKTDLSPVHEALGGINEAVKGANMSLSTTELLDQIKQFFLTDVETIKQTSQQIMDAIAKLPQQFDISVTPKASEPAQPAAPESSAFQP